MFKKYILLLLTINFLYTMEGKEDIDAIFSTTPEEFLNNLEHFKKRVEYEINQLHRPELTNQPCEQKQQQPQIKNRNDKRFLCSTCNTYYTTKGNLRKHEKSIHEKNLYKKNYCLYCNKKFPFPYVLKRHKKTKNHILKKHMHNRNEALTE